MSRSFVPPCEAACPALTDVQGYVGAAALGNFVRSYKIAGLTNPFMNSCAFICSHPCEKECRRGGVEEAISIMELKRAAVVFGDNSGEVASGEIASSPRSSPACRQAGNDGTSRYSDLTLQATETAVKKVAVIGAGPAGLTAAQDLAAAGRDVTVFERLAKAGGQLRSTLPNYRLPEEYLDRDISAIDARGVKIEYGRELGKDISLVELRRDYDAVIVATGLPVSRSLPVFPADNPSVLGALSFLAAVKKGAPPLIKPEVIVVGGGNVAIDAARSAVRLGAARVELVCLESRAEMPAHEWEITEALDEGVKLNNRYGPAEVLLKGSDVAGLKCQVVKSVFSPEGRFDPVFIEGKYKEIKGGTIIVAIGQGRESGVLGKDADAVTAGAAKGVFPAGEFASGPGAAIDAIQSGHLAANAVEAYLSGKDDDSARPRALMQLSDRMRPLVKKADRRAPSYTSGARRKKDFKIFDPGLSRVEAIKEAARCMACLSGAVVDPVKCIACLTCVRVCPFEIPKIDFDNKSFINMAECQACGLCITECPATAIGYSRGQAEDLLQATLAAAKSGSVEFVCVNGLDESEELPPSASIVLVNCVSGIGQNLLLLALLNGAESVTVTPGREHECKNKGGRGLVAGRVAKVKEALRALGIDPETVVYKE